VGNSHTKLLKKRREADLPGVFSCVMNSMGSWGFNSAISAIAMKDGRPVHLCSSSRENWKDPESGERLRILYD
jgi:hypothetical protein